MKFISLFAGIGGFDLGLDAVAQKRITCKGVKMKFCADCRNNRGEGTIETEPCTSCYTHRDDKNIRTKPSFKLKSQCRFSKVEGK